MGTPQGMLDYVVESSISPSSIGGILKCVSDSLSGASPPSDKTSQAIPHSRVAQPDVMLRMTERLLTEIVDGYNFSHNGIHSLAFRPRTDCYVAMRNLVGDEANSLKFRDEMARYQGIIGKYRRGEDCSPQEIGQLRNFCDRICVLADKNRASEYKH
jgi:hypothetical protein